MRINIYLSNKILFVTFCGYEDGDYLKVIVSFNMRWIHKIIITIDQFVVPGIRAIEEPRDVLTFISVSAARNSHEPPRWLSCRAFVSHARDRVSTPGRDRA